MDPMARTRRISSWLLGVAWVALGLWMLGFFAIATIIIRFTQFTRYTGQSWRSFVFVITGPRQIGYVLGCLGLAAFLGGLGLRLMRADRRENLTRSLRASAVRFCLLGLLGAVLNAAVLAGLLAYRWLG
jgi:hypothetical protein